MLYIIMGVSGCGKSSLGACLSEKLGWRLHEGDDFHPQENIDKMAKGEPLTDQTDLNKCLREAPLEQMVKAAGEELLTGAKGTLSGGIYYRLVQPDRLPWLLRLHEVIESEMRSGSDALLTCSALKRLYRQILLHGSRALAPSCPGNVTRLPTSPRIYFLFLHGDFELLNKRILARKGHYMKADLLRSQFDDLEPPLEEENTLLLDVSSNISDMATEVERHLTSLKSS